MPLGAELIQPGCEQLRQNGRLASGPIDVSKKRGLRYRVEFAKTLLSTSDRMLLIACGSSGNGSSKSAAISRRLRVVVIGGSWKLPVEPTNKLRCHLQLIAKRLGI
jgi:hypothetical protein